MTYDYRAMACAASVRGPVVSGWVPTAEDRGWPREVDEPKPEVVEGEESLKAFVAGLVRSKWIEGIPDPDKDGRCSEIWCEVWDASVNHPEWPGKRDDNGELEGDVPGPIIRRAWAEETERRASL